MRGTGGDDMINGSLSNIVGNILQVVLIGAVHRANRLGENKWTISVTKVKDIKYATLTHHRGLILFLAV